MIILEQRAQQILKSGTRPLKYLKKSSGHEKILEQDEKSKMSKEHRKINKEQRS